MRQILLDGQPFTYGNSLEEIADFSGIDIDRFSWGDEYIEEPLTPIQELELAQAKASTELVELILALERRNS